MKLGAACLGIATLLASCTTTLERGLTEAQADEVIVVLGEHGIGAAKETDPSRGDFAIVVGERDVASALGVMRDEGLPRTDAPGAAEAYAEPSLIPTAGEERARAASASSADLARSIEAMPGVHDARVHLGLPDPSAAPIDDPSPLATASVLVRAASDAPIDEAAIRALVAAAVPGLGADHVTVVRVALPAARARSEALVSVGPIFVTAGSATLLRALLACMLAVNILLAAAIGIVVRRRR